MTTDSAPDEQPSDPTPPGTSTGAGKPWKPRHSLGQRLMLMVSLMVVLGCFAAGAALLWAKSEREQFRAAIRPVIVTTTGLSTGPVQTGADGQPLPPQTFPPADPDAINFLVAGSDGEACIDPDSPWANAADPERDPGTRSDTIMVMRLDPTTERAAVLSFPRDLWVEIPGRSPSRINSAFVDGDPTRLAQTIYDNFGIFAPEYVQIDFCAFKTIVEAIGGVSVPFEFPMYDNNLGLNIPDAGCHRFMGDEALAYVRSRHLHWIDENGKDHADQSADLGRISRQQDFLRRMLRTSLNKGVFNPGVASGLMDTLQEYVYFSEGTSINDMLEWAGVIADIEPDSIRTYQVQADRRIIGGNDVLVPQDSDEMDAILRIFRGEATMAGAPQQALDTTTAETDASTDASSGDSQPESATTSSPAGSSVATDASDTAPVVADPPADTASADTEFDGGVFAPESILYGVVPPADISCPGS
jgi:LCP family protein required for cell wall assembly